MLKVIATVLTTLLLGTGLAQQGQQPAAPAAGSPYTLQVRAQAVVLDVVVTDRKGHVVNGLDKDAFTVYEDGVAQVVRSVDRSASEMPVKAVSINSTAELDRKAPAAPVNILVLDEINTRFEDEAFARYSMKRYVETQGAVMPPTMLVAVDLDHFRVLQDFTTSKEAMLAAVKRVQMANPWRAGGADWKVQQMTAAINSLMRVSQATSGHSGHKTMIWIGRGFPAIDPEGMEPEQADQLKKAIEECTNAMRDARVVLYTLDPAGVSTAPVSVDAMGFTEDPFGQSVDFERMALASGGKAFSGRNDVDHLIATSAQEGTMFYTLSYVPGVARDGEKPFRSIKVVMRDPTLTASTRIGYYTRAAEPAAAPDGSVSHQMMRDLALAGEGTLVYDAVPFTVERDAKDPDQFVVKVPSAELVWKRDEGGNLTTEVSVLVKVFDGKGNVLEQNARMQHLTFPAVAGQDMPSATVTALPMTIRTEAPAARIRLALRVDATGKIGTNNYFLVEGKVR